jgi:RHS repeat-associated protein
METDPTGLNHTLSRYYIPGLQRFLSEDPMGFNDGANLFTYGLNNPVNNTDPLGQACEGGECGGGQPQVIVPVRQIDDFFQSFFENLFNDLFGGLFGGGGHHHHAVLPRKLRHRWHIIFSQYTGISEDLVLAQNTSRSVDTHTWVFSVGGSVSLGNTVASWDSRQGSSSALLFGYSLGLSGDVRLTDPRVFTGKAWQGATADIGLGHNLGVGLTPCFYPGAGPGGSGGHYGICAVQLNVGPSIGLPFGLESPVD